MFKACSRCGKIHPYNQKCNVGKVYVTTDERKLRSKNKWHEKSEEIRESANYLCEVCRDQGKITYDNLEVHHIIPLKIAPELLLDNLNLVCLCSYHHKLAEAGEIKASYLQELAKKREKDMPRGIF